MSKDKGLDSFYPNAFHSADRLATSTKARFFLFLKIRLLCLFLAALSAGVGSFQFEYSRWIAIAGLIFFCGAFVSSLFSTFIKFETKWYLSRSLAESIKSICWKYAVFGEPYGDKHGSSGNDSSQYISDMKAIIKQSIQQGLVLPTVDQVWVTTEMQKLRNSDLTIRLERYREDRIANQFAWYESSAKLNLLRDKQFSMASLCILLLALAYTTFAIANSSVIGFTGALSSGVAILTAWSQAQQFRSLAAAYSNTAVDISFARQSGASIKKQSEFESFVSDTENAISREHTVWRARRDIA